MPKSRQKIQTLRVPQMKDANHIDELELKKFSQRVIEIERDYYFEKRDRTTPRRNKLTELIDTIANAIREKK